MQRLRLITGCTLDRINLKNYDGTPVHQARVIAQDVRAALPEATSQDSDEQHLLSVEPLGLIALLTKAVKELDSRIAQLELA